MPVISTPVALDVIEFDLTRLPNVSKLDFGNGANRSMSLDFSIVSTQLTKAALTFFSAVSRSYVMLSVAFTGSVTFLDLKGLSSSDYSSFAQLSDPQELERMHYWRYDGLQTIRPQIKHCSRV